MGMGQRATLLINLGSPDSPAVADVRRYLGEFLMDERVIDIPGPLRSLLVKGIILNTRPKKSAHAYAQIWSDDGSPLVAISRRLTALVQAQLDHPVAMAMRYQNPSIDDVVGQLLAEHSDLTELLVAPLYPHYAMATTESVMVAVRSAVARSGRGVNIRVLPPCFDHPAYIEAMVQVAAPLITSDVQKVLFSFHGIPTRHIERSDCTGSHCLQRSDCCEVDSPAHGYCYRHQAVRTMQLMMKGIGLHDDRAMLTFQSRLTNKWLQPFTDRVLEELPKQGITRIAILCPAFVSDCLETLEEVALRGRESFLAAGGESYVVIPCMNEHPAWVAALAGMLREAWNGSSFVEIDSLAKRRSPAFLRQQAGA
jgi:protoporphyrin/coproporphyrin ferrochelatase